jgi:hypothetical protein
VHCAHTSQASLAFRCHRTGVAFSLSARDIAQWTHPIADNICYRSGPESSVPQFTTAACRASLARASTAAAAFANQPPETRLACAVERCHTGSSIAWRSVCEHSAAAASQHCTGLHRLQGPAELDQVTFVLKTESCTIASMQTHASSLASCSLLCVRDVQAMHQQARSRNLGRATGGSAQSSAAAACAAAAHGPACCGAAPAAGPDAGAPGAHHPAAWSTSVYC